VRRALPNPRRAGFTIVEVLMAMGILLFGAAAIIAFLTFGSATARHAQLRTQATTAVEAIAADIDRHLFPYEKGVLGEPRVIERRPVPGVPGVVYTARAVQNPDEEREYRVDIEMRWESAGVRRSKQWSMLKIREVPFGERLRREFIEKTGGFRPANEGDANDPDANDEKAR